MDNKTKKILVFSEDEELSISLKRYIRYSLNKEMDFITPSKKPLDNITKDYCLLILDLTSSGDDNEEKFMEYLTGSNVEKIPITLIFSPEPAITNFQNYLGKSSILLFTEIFYEYYRIVFVPGKITEHIKESIQSNFSFPNPFQNLEGRCENIKKTFFKKPPKKDLKDIFVEAGMLIYEETRSKAKIPFRHGKESELLQDKKNQMWFYYLLLASLFTAKRLPQPLKILWIENNPERNLESINSCLPLYINCNSIKEIMKQFCNLFNFEIDILEAGFKETYYALLKYRESIEEARITVSSLKDAQNSLISLKNIEKYSLILVDIFLGEDVDVNGVDFIRMFTNLFPHIPTFILSVCDDYEVVSDAIRSGADYYILKNDILSLPLAYFLFIRNLGRVIEFINNDTLKKSIIGNIRYWTFKKNFLWFGDKCYHMVEHAYQHTLEDWIIANIILGPLLQNKYLSVSDDMLYSFLMAIWLHDIGHKGNGKYGEPYQIRDNHGYISAEFILKYPHLLGIDDSDQYYKDLYRSKKRTNSAVKVLYQRIKKKKNISITEMIALFTLYHKSNCPITEKEFKKINSQERFVPLEYFEKGEPQAIMTLEKIVKVLEDQAIQRHLLILAFLFRLIDSLDISHSRVGDVTEEAFKKIVIENDRLYITKKLKKERKKMAIDGSWKSLVQKSKVIEVLKEDVIDRKESGKNLSFGKLKKSFSYANDSLNFKKLENFASFIALQPDHFDLHSSIEKLKIEFDGRFIIYVFLNKPKQTLQKKKIKERGWKEETLWDRIAGNKHKKISSYFFREWESGWEILENILRDIPEIRLVPLNGIPEKAWINREVS